MSEEEFPQPEQSQPESADRITANTLPLPVRNFLDQVTIGLKSAQTFSQHRFSRAASALSDKTMLIAFSGGPDSTALLSALVSLSKALKLRLRACHVNHHLRGDESQRDEIFCRQLCHQLQIPLDVHHLEHKLHSESQLRDERYRLLAESALQSGCALVLTGHTLDDQAETMLFRLFRGSAPSGLKAMEYARQLSDALLLWRPLLSIERSSCLSYLQAIDLPSVNDSSNETIDYTRNYIRHRIVPPIAERFPGFQKRLIQLREIIAGEDEYLNDIAQEKLAQLIDSANSDAWQLSMWQRQNPAIQRRIIAAALKQRKIEVSFARVEEILQLAKRASTGDALSLNGEWDIGIRQKHLQWVDKARNRGSVSAAEQIARLPGMTILPALGAALKIEALPPSSKPHISFPKSQSLEALVDLSQVKTPLVVRTRHPGDRIRPFGMKQTVHLKKYLHTHKSPALDEQTLRPLFLLADQEEVLWIPGLGLSEKIRVHHQATHRLTWLKLTGDDMNLC